jgi:type II secretory pathway pseudopilin PulG
MHVSRRRGFTLLQLLVVLTVLFLVVGLLLARLLMARGAAERAVSTSHLKQMCIATHDCAAANDFAIPPSAGNFAGKPGRSFFFHICPYIEQNNVWQNNVTDVILKLYIAPLDPTNHGAAQPWTSYATNAAVFGVNPNKPSTLPARFGTKGTSKTIILMERYAVASTKIHPWADAGELATYLDGPNSLVEVGLRPQNASNTAAHAFSPVGCQVGLGDGAVRNISPQMKLATFRWACDPDAKPAPPTDW